MFDAALNRRALLASLPAWLACGLADPAAAALAKGDSVRWPELRLLDGRSWGAGDAEGRAVVAVFWSLTCPFCRRHNEHVQKLHQAAAGLPLTVLGISRDKDEAAVRRYLAERRYSFPVTLDHAPLAALLAPRNIIPLTAVVARDGRLRQVYSGEMFEEDVMELLALAGAPQR